MYFRVFEVVDGMKRAAMSGTEDRTHDDAADYAPAPSAMTLPALLDDLARQAPDREAIVAGDRRLTYAQFADLASTAAVGFADLGVGANDVVGLLAPNVVEWPVAAFGALHCGARVDAFNTWARAYDLGQFLASSRASVLVICDAVRGRDMVDELYALIPQLRDEAPGQWHSDAFDALRSIVVLGERCPRGAISWQDLMDRAAQDATPVPLPADDRAPAPAFVLYTSGSTKYPKAVPLAHRDLVLNGFYIGERMGLSEDDRVWLGSPLFWSYGCANAMMATMTHRACLVLDEEFAPDTTAAVMETESVTAAYLLPAMIDALADADGGEVARRIRAVPSLRTGLTIGRPEEVERAVVDLGVTQICNVYGSTETYGNCCVSDHRAPLKVRLTRQGRPLPGVQARIVDTETGRVLPAGEAGEMQVRGRVMSGYLNDDESNKTAFTDDGWFRTGDRMRIVGDGTVVFIGRMTDMIKTSGINVSPAEVESFLVTHPDITEATVVGAPHPSRGEVVIAFVISRSADITEADVIAFCRQNIASYKAPWAVSIVPDLPRTGTGKLLRRALRGDAEAIVHDRLDTIARTSA